MKTNTYLPFLLLLLLGFTWISTSCNSEETLEGTWILQEIISSDCEEDDVTIQNTLIEGSNGPCIEITTTNSTNVTETITILCQSISLEESGEGQLVTSDNMTAETTTPLSYTLDNGILLICGGGDCNNYTLENDELILEDRELSEIGRSCNTIRTYKK